MGDFRIVVAALVFAVPVVAQSDSERACPMMSSGQHQSGVDERHDRVTGVGHEASAHHFLLAPGGGSIRLETTKDGGREDRDMIRTHLKHIAEAFAAADFSLPMFIHDKTPPGVDVMKARHALIHYEYSGTKNGGQIRISTRDPDALSAVHAFLRFQIQDHATGDPTTFD
jgi:hypothetical protein